jgi:hypothetical protein
MDEAIKALVGTYGLPGIVIAVLLVAVWWLSTNLLAALKAQQVMTEKYLDQKYKDSADMLEVLRNLRTSMDVTVRTMETAMSVLKSKA